MTHEAHSNTRSHYWWLAINLIVSVVVMYFVMFAMIATVGDFYHNINMWYMALMMVAPMAIIMLLTMRGMYTSPTINGAIYAGFAILCIAAFFWIRTQALVGDKQFLRSMIPHHSGAILMCQNASITDPEILTLCTRIIQSQREEIVQMKRILDRIQ